MANKYLEKIAGLSQALKGTSSLERVGLGMSASGLGMSAANLTLGLQRDKKDIKKMGLEEKSLNTLKDIHKELAKTS